MVKPTKLFFQIRLTNIKNRMNSKNNNPVDNKYNLYIRGFGVLGNSILS